MSLDGFGAGPNQNIENPLGVGGPLLMNWFFHTRIWQQMHGNANSGETGVDNEMAAQGFAGIGAWILGRNMFGPVRGPWPDESWKGWWGSEPPYHTPVFVLTHHPRPPLRMAGTTEFRFVTGGIDAALQQAREAACGRDVRLGGGVATIRQYLGAALIDELHLAIRPVLLGAGESGPLDSAATGLTKTFVGGVVADLLVMPWGYVLANYVKRPGDSWRFRSPLAAPTVPTSFP